MTDIVKVGLIHQDGEGRILLVRKRGTRMFILPGGKPEGREIDTSYNPPLVRWRAALTREIREELGTTVDTMHYHRAFTAEAANEPGQTVTVHVVEGQLRDEPVAQAEIEELLWYGEMDPPRPDIAASLTEQILPYVWERIVA